MLEVERFITGDSEVVEVLHLVASLRLGRSDLRFMLVIIPLDQTVGLLSIHEPRDAEAEVDGVHDAVIQVHVDVLREEKIILVARGEEACRVGADHLVACVGVEPAFDPVLLGNRGTRLLRDLCVPDVGIVFEHLLIVFNLNIFLAGLDRDMEQKIRSILDRQRFVSIEDQKLEQLLGLLPEDHEHQVLPLLGRSWVAPLEVSVNNSQVLVVSIISSVPGEEDSLIFMHHLWYFKIMLLQICHLEDETEALCLLVDVRVALILNPLPIGRHILARRDELVLCHRVLSEVILNHCSAAALLGSWWLLLLHLRSSWWLLLFILGSVLPLLQRDLNMLGGLGFPLLSLCLHPCHLLRLLRLLGLLDGLSLGLLGLLGFLGLNGYLDFPIVSSPFLNLHDLHFVGNRAHLQIWVHY